MAQFVGTAFLVCVLGHPNSLSSSQIRITGREVGATTRCQIRSLLEVIEGLDTNGDGSIDRAEIASKTEAILAYFDRHHILYTGTDRSLDGGRRLAAEPIGVRYYPPGIDKMLPSVSGTVDVERRYRAIEPIHDIVVESTLFHDTSPDHIDLVQVEWDAGVTEHLAANRRTPKVRSDPSGRGAFMAYLTLGFKHMLDGWDHLAFLAALILATRTIRALLLVVTAFTAAHSVTLALASFDVVNVSRHMSVIEATIALSLAYVAADNLFHPRITRSRWPESFVFGLVHGLGFASFLGQSLVRESAKWVALLSFNLGVEFGQILVAVLLVAGLRLAWRLSEKTETALAPPAARIVGSVVIAALGLFWFFQRI